MVEKAFRAYLRCGVFAHGFLHFHCDGCGQDLLVAFSCKGRGLCPSCGARRMCNTAAHIVDRVLPAVPVRQWVLSLPFEIRRLAAFRSDVATAMGRIFIEEIARDQKQAAATSGAQHGAVNFLQRFGGSLNLNLHYHAVVADGVFLRGDGGRMVFREALAPSAEALVGIVRRVRDRAYRWLRKRGYLEERAAEERSNEAPEQSALEACAEAALRGGRFVRLEQDDVQVPDASEARFEAKRRGPLTVEVDGFNVQAAVRIEGWDDEGRERLVRYCARPCFALERLSVLRSGDVAYGMKYPTRGATHRRMTPVELLARLSALVPPPRYPLVRYHGVFAPHAKLRSAVVPRPQRTPCTGDLGTGAALAEKDGRTPALEKGGVGQKAKERGPEASEVRSEGETPVPRPPRATKLGNEVEQASRVTPIPPSGALPVFGVEGGRARNGNASAILATIEVFSVPQGISVRHMGRLQGGLLLAMSPRVPWAQLLRRTYQVDVLSCAGCGGKMRLSGAVTEPAVAREILALLGLPLEAPESRARDPAEEMAWSDGPVCSE